MDLGQAVATLRIGVEIPKVFVLDGEKLKAVENGRGSSMGWLIACEQARFFLRLSFLAFPPSVIFPSTVRSLRSRHPFSLSSSSRLHHIRSYVPPRTILAILSLNYTFIPPCIFATSLQAVNVPDYIILYNDARISRYYIVIDSPPHISY